MAFGTGRGPLLGGTFSALNIAAPTVIKLGSGQFWSAQIISVGTGPGYFYDAGSIAGVNGLQTLVVIPAGQITPVGGPFPVAFFTGLVFIPFTDMTASVFYS